MRFLFSLAICAVLAGCASTSLPPVSKGTILEDDEKRLWNRAREEERELDRSGHLYADKALESYINEVAKRLVPDEIYSVIPFKIKVINNPYLNAFAYPSGAVYVHTGILARMENEAQLATLLAHEMVHSTHRHGVKGFRGVKNKSAVLASFQGTIGIIPLVGTLGELGVMSSVYGHSRELETEADTEGLRQMARAGYDPREAPKLFLHMKQEMEEEDVKEPFFFGTHPRLNERVKNYEALLKKQYAGKTGTVNRDQFLGKTLTMVLDNAQLDLKAGRFGVAGRGIDKYLANRPGDGRAHYLKGELFRQRGEKGDLDKAKEQYQKASNLNSAYAEPHKGLGMVHLKQGNKGLAVRSFKTYLSMSPNAPDRPYIEEYMK